MSASSPRLVLVDFVAKLPDGSIIDTTQEGNENSDLPDIQQRPRLVSLGYPSFVVTEGFEEALKGAELDMPQTIQVEPKNAYGVWDRKMVRMITARKLNDSEKYGVGDEVEISGRKGIIKFMGSGRVQVDYNHKYAGKTIQYDFTVTDLLDTDDAKVVAILRETLTDDEFGSDDDLDYILQDNSLNVTIPENMAKSESLHSRIHQLQMNIFRFAPDIKDIQFVIKYKNKH
ncbi:MAG: peptidylprolyl isomerase [Cenarchaeum sp. SB0665_bin_23]|nr:peptidylprolyl isomerase [Cenarchaeum sp. SB0667_bin_13]MXY38168.1 peptidylprolyl isomerase [Cenarchaeum sp. SB0664_bin_35]MXY60887.1 peptidylprolyl isomerase [Cenarchaeum sp. SB0665_bin_23]MXZ92906.1 peptidylprolyl isomerase [Cenarchaeum sp. SB0666_bin_15]MYB47129.1 peptidylprolyl isomerase [Cenarchaeum sp. SB0662_bin_33]MYC80323.1 peptidylprolyl isomerase [Cenarchaeum sp. SB0661_bin_35]MYD58845.1 peptidylprolyl isomerase [Cenarchaeum sp. SB0678_bin_8]MYG32779.1 peptidylprolyl isomerase 